MTTHARPVLWDIYEEHLDEAAFLWERWRAAMDSAIYNTLEVIDGPQSRLWAHLDALVLGGAPVATRMLLPTLTDEDAEPSRRFVAAWCLLRAEDPEETNHLDLVLSLLEGAAEPAARALARAIELACAPQSPRLTRWETRLKERLAARWALADAWDVSSPRLRAILLDVNARDSAANDPSVLKSRVADALVDADPTLRSAALRSLRLVPDRLLLPQVESCLSPLDDQADQDPPLAEGTRRSLRWEALATAFLMKAPWLWDVSRREATANGSAARLALALLATRPSEHEWLIAQARGASLAPHALWALGFAGTPAVADVLVESMAIETGAKAVDVGAALARIAGESFTTVVGIPILGALARPGKTQGPGDADVADDDPVPEVRSEDNLAEPHPDNVRKAWHARRSSFPKQMPCLLGAPLSDGALPSILNSVSTWRRDVVALMAYQPPSRDWARGG